MSMWAYWERCERFLLKVLFNVSILLSPTQTKWDQDPATKDWSISLLKGAGLPPFFHFFQLCRSIWLGILSSLTFRIHSWPEEKKTSPKLVYLLTDRLACRLAKLLTEEYLSLPLTQSIYCGTKWTQLQLSDFPDSAVKRLTFLQNFAFASKETMSFTQQQHAKLQWTLSTITKVLMLWWYWTKICRGRSTGLILSVQKPSSSSLSPSRSNTATLT